jgi:outer membrane protein OmpA-like peptidoglycan-associated protein
MKTISRTPKSLLAIALLAATAPAGLAAQAPQAPEAPPTELNVDVSGTGTPDAAAMVKGPKIEGIISARQGNKLQVTGAAGATTIFVNENTKVTSTGGFLGANRDKLGTDSLLNGLPVSVQTWQAEGVLVANRIQLKAKDLKTASMISHGTAQGFAEQTAATDALRNRVADIGQYNIKGTTNVNFAIGKANLTAQAKADLCAAAAQADATKNAMLLVVGYTDSTGSQELNQRLSEKRAASVTNHLQQACGWKPYRMLTPTGMAEADPTADNTTPEGKALNRRVAVNILVSKGLDGL